MFRPTWRRAARGLVNRQLRRLSRHPRGAAHDLQFKEGVNEGRITTGPTTSTLLSPREEALNSLEEVSADQHYASGGESAPRLRLSERVGAAP